MTQNVKICLESDDVLKDIFHIAKPLASFLFNVNSYMYHGEICNISYALLFKYVFELSHNALMYICFLYTDIKPLDKVRTSVCLFALMDFPKQ